jgi:hypothetical protein
MSGTMSHGGENGRDLPLPQRQQPQRNQVRQLVEQKARPLRVARQAQLGPVDQKVHDAQHQE